MSAKATLKRLNSNSSGNDDLTLDAQSGENLNHGLYLVKFTADGVSETKKLLLK